MAQFNSIPLFYALLIAFLDAIMLVMVKEISINRQIFRWMILPTLIYALHPWIFLQSLQFESLILMNLMVDLLSGLFVTLFGLFYFHESLGGYKLMGVILSFVSIILMSLNDGK
jgi:drug/metabolite transporter (DMT)-like permease